MSRLHVFLIALVLFSSGVCTPIGVAEQVENESHFVHTVRYQGETLGLISLWYTGKSGNWEKVAQINPGINLRNLRSGNVVRIPKNIAKRTATFTSSFIQTKQVPSNDEAPVQGSGVAPDAVAPAVTSLTVTDEQPKLLSNTPNDELFAAVLMADATLVSKALSKGADKNFTYNNRSILGWAAQHKNPDVVETLIKAGANVNFVDGIGHSPLMRAVDTRQIANTKLLLNAKALPDLKNQQGETALHIAIKNNDAEAMQALIDAGADVNAATSDGETPLLMALHYNHAHLIPMLANAKADMNTPNSIYTPLQNAVGQNSPSMVRALLLAGANPNFEGPDGRTPIFQAVNKPEILKMLISAKAEINVTGPYNETPLSLAIQGEALEPVQLLVEAGAAINMRDYAGTSVLGTAMRQNKSKMAKYLQSKGAIE